MQLAGDFGAVFDVADACIDRGDMEGAVVAFRAGVDRAPDNPVALYNLATAQLQAGQLYEGAETLVGCLRLAPDFTDAHINLASALLRMGLLPDARAIADIAVQLRPDLPEALMCLAGVLHHAGENAASAELYQRAVRMVPGHAMGLTSLGNALGVLGRMEESLSAHDQAVQAALGSPEQVDCRVNRAMALLASGDFAQGWAENEWRWQRPGQGARFSVPAWRGEKVAGQRVLLHAEQGLGDTLQFVRYAGLVAALGARVTLQVQPPLVRLLQISFPALAVQGLDEAAPLFDWHCPMMSLPLVFGTTLRNIPADGAYVVADPPAIARWAAVLDSQLPRERGKWVGLVWAGSPNKDAWEARLTDQRRSLRPTDLSALARLSGVQFVSLQKDAAPPGLDGLNIANFMGRVADFADTAALVASLDLVISVDTSVAHLAASMGRPVWMLSRYDGCWRWMGHRADTPWYPSMRLYHQPRPGDWATVLSAIRGDLANFLERQGASDHG